MLSGYLCPVITLGWANVVRLPVAISKRNILPLSEVLGSRAEGVGCAIGLDNASPVGAIDLPNADDLSIHDPFLRDWPASERISALPYSVH